MTATYTVNVTKQGTSSGETTASDEGEVETTEETDSSENTVTVNGISYVIAENFATENIPADFSETTVNYQGADYRGVSYDKGSVVMLYLVQDGAEESTGSFFVYDSTRDTLYPFVKMVNGEHYVIALLPPVDYTMPDTMQQTQLTLADGSLVTAYQETQEEGSEVESEFYTFYGVNSDGTEGWYQYDSIEETYQRVNTGTTVSSDGLQDEDAAYLQEEYLALSEKYKKEKAFSRTAIGILIFLLAVMAVVLVNLLLHRREADRDDLDEDDTMDDGVSEHDDTEELLDENQDDVIEEPEKDSWKSGTGRSALLQMPGMQMNSTNRKREKRKRKRRNLTMTRSMMHSMRMTSRRKSRRRRDSVSGSGSLTIWMTICLMMTTRTRMMTRTGMTMTRMGMMTRTGMTMRRTMKKKKFQAAKIRKTSKTMSWIS